MSARSAGAKLWQHPFVNVFKLCHVENWKDAQKEGDVHPILDKAIGKKALRISGNVPAANFVQLPKSRAHALGLTGRYVYVEVKIDQSKYFVMHFDVVTADKFSTRVSVSNLFKQSPSKTKVTGIQIPYTHVSDKWIILVVDLAACLKPHTHSALESIKGIQLCANMTVRNVFTSDQRYDSNTLPREMALSHGKGAGTLYEFRWLPPGTGFDTTPLVALDEGGARPASAPARSNRQATARKPAAARQILRAMQPVAGGGGSAIEEGGAVATKDQVRVIVHTGPNPEPLFRRPLAPAGAAAHRGGDPSSTPSRPAGPGGATPASSAPFSPGAGSTLDGDSVFGGEMAAMSGLQTALEPDPIMEMSRVIGYSGEHARSVQWAASGESLVFPCNSTVVRMEKEGGAQSFLTGHTANVCCLAYSGDGAVLATGQEGRLSLIRLWDSQSGKCVAILNAHAGGLCALDVSADGRALAAVGLDSHGLQMIAVWDISTCLRGEKARLVVKHSTDYHVKCLKFSPFEEDRLMTCGRDSIRVYRLKGGKLRGCSIQLGEHAKSGAPRIPSGISGAHLSRNVFTDIAYEMSYGLTELAEKHVFVSSVSGAVFQINYGKRVLECVFQLHSGAINSLVINDGFCVTGSDDRFLRVWPVDFSDFFLEAEHEAPVTSVSVSPDGLQIAVGTENGSIGTLDVPSHLYSTVMRSHTGTITAVAVDPRRSEFCTVSEDGSIRVWDMYSSQQLYEFDAPGESPQSVAYHPAEYVVAVGFANGMVRVFSVASTSLIQEHRQHKGAVLDVLFVPDGSRMITAGAEGNLCVYDVALGYLPIKYLATSLPNRRVAAAVSRNGQMLASIGPDASCVLMFHLPSLAPHCRIDSASEGVSGIRFSPDGRHVLVTTTDRRLECYDVETGGLVQSVLNIHRSECGDFDVDDSGSFVVTGGADHLVKVFAYPAGLTSLPPPSQSFIGHGDSVLGVKFADQSRRVVSVGHGDAIVVWRFSDDAAEREAAEGGSSSGIGGAAPFLLRGAAGSAGSSGGRKVSWVGDSDPSGSADAEGGAMGYDGTLRPPPASLPLRHWRSPDPHLHVAHLPKARMELPSRGGLLELRSLVGYEGGSFGAHDNVLWHSDSGTFAYSAGHAVMLEDLQTRKQRPLLRHTQPVSCMALSADGSTLASGSGSADGSGMAAICVWDTRQARCMHVLCHHRHAVQALAFHQGGQLLVSVGAHPEGTILVWEVVTGALLAVGQCLNPVHDVAWVRTPNGAPPRFVTAGDDGVLAWSLEDGGDEGGGAAGPAGGGGSALAYEAMPAPEGAAGARWTSVAAGPGGEVWAGDQEGFLWCLRGGAGDAAPPCCVRSAVGEVAAICARGDKLMAAGASGQVAVWARSANGGWALDDSVDLDGPVVAMQWSASGDEAVLGTAAATVWYLNTVEECTIPVVSGHAAGVEQVASGASDPLHATASADGTVRVWAADGFQKLLHFEVVGASATAVAVNPQERQCAAGFGDGKLRIFGLDTVTVEQSCQPHVDAVVGVAYSQDGLQLLSASRDGVLTITDVGTGDPECVLHDLTRHPRTLDCLAVSPLQRGVCAGAWVDRVEVFTAPWQKQDQYAMKGMLRCQEAEGLPVPTHIPALVRFAPDDESVVLFTSAATSQSVLVFDFETEQILRQIPLPHSATSLCISPGGSLLGIGTASARVMVCKYNSPSATDAVGDVRSTLLKGLSWHEAVMHDEPVRSLSFGSETSLVSAAGKSMAEWKVGL